MAGRLLLAPLQAAIEEIHSKREDFGTTNFDRDEPAVIRLLNSIEPILTHGIIEEKNDSESPVANMGATAFSFLTTALQAIKPATPLTHDALWKCEERHLFKPHQKLKYWIVCAVTMSNALATSISAILNLTDVVEAFYLPTSALRDSDFKTEFLSLLPLVYAHPSLGPIHYTLETSAVTAMEESLDIEVRRRKPRGTVKKTRSKSVLNPSVVDPIPNDSVATDATHLKVSACEEKDATGSTSALTPRDDGFTRSKPHRRTPVSQVFIDQWSQTGDAEEEREELIDKVTRWRLEKSQNASVQTDHPAPTATYEELCEFEHVLVERELYCKAAVERIRKTEAALEERALDAIEQYDQVARLLTNLKTLYNDHFSLVKDAQDAGAAVNVGDLDPILPQLMSLILVQGAHLDPHGGSAVARTQQRPRADSGASLSGDSSDMPEGSAAPASTGDTRARAPSYTSLLTRPETSASGRVSGFVAAPDAPICRAIGDRPWTTQEVIEKDRQIQLATQRHRCPDCNAELPSQSTSSNPILQAMKKAGQLAQKPRRCHYCGEIYCQNCHVNKVAALPFKILHRWDFKEYHVCNRDFDFLVQNYERPLLYLPTLPAEMRSRRAVEVVAKTRAKLNRMYPILLQCSQARAALGTALTQSHYFQRESWYSVADLVRLRQAEQSESKGLFGMARSPSGNDLVAHLQALYNRASEHILRQCPACRSRAVGHCSICGDVEEVIIFETGVICEGCGELHHTACAEIMSCRGKPTGP